jgi:hypothetical protein
MITSSGFAWNDMPMSTNLLVHPSSGLPTGPVDTVMISRSDDDLCKNCPSQVKARIRFKVPESVSVFTLHALLFSFITKSTRYIAMTQNTWFFCSVVLSALCHRYPNTVEGKLGNQVDSLSPDSYAFHQTPKSSRQVCCAVPSHPKFQPNASPEALRPLSDPPLRA